MKLDSRVLVTLFVAACSGGEVHGPITAEGAVPSRDEIVGGFAFSDLPAVGALTLNGNPHCTGTLIEPRKVLTAAHCVDGFSAARMRFVIGPSLAQAQAVVPVARLEPHPGYNESTLVNDIGLVHLSQDAPVAPMGNILALNSSFVGSSLLFVGYGASNGINKTGSGTKRAVSMPIADIRATQFSYRTAGRNTCNGDSGGPAFHIDDAGNHLIAGVTSFGDANCTVFGVDTRVDAFFDFVNSGSQPPSNCNGETFEGRCDDGDVVWCEDNTVHRTDCASQGKVCAFASQQGFFGCLETQSEPEPTPPPTPADPCNGETFEGRCDGSTVVWCEANEVHRTSCGGQGKVCAFSDDHGYFGCLESAAPADPCKGETFEGRCDGNRLVWCQNESVLTINCTWFGGTCGFNASAQYNACL